MLTFSLDCRATYELTALVAHIQAEDSDATDALAAEGHLVAHIKVPPLCCRAVFIASGPCSAICGLSMQDEIPSVDWAQWTLGREQPFQQSTDLSAALATWWNAFQFG